MLFSPRRCLRPISGRIHNLILSSFLSSTIANKFLKEFWITCSLYGFQDSLLFQPNEPDTSRTVVMSPDSMGLPFETVTIETPDNEKLHGYLIKQQHRYSEKDTMIFFHGNAGNIGHRLQNAQILYRSCDINILLFDYRGYGKSTGTPSEMGLYTDAQAVYDFVRKREDLNQEKIFLFGRSLGGAVAFHLASELGQMNSVPPLSCVMVENTFTSIPEMAKRLFQVFVLDYVPNWCYKNVFSSLSKIRHIKVPVLFLSGGQDELVPTIMMQKLFEECKSQKKYFHNFPDGMHNTTWLASDYSQIIRKFLIDCNNERSRHSSSSDHKGIDIQNFLQQDS
ncbi:unnamed protein product [Didymodactylos carnosus]|uniref:Protein ABHD13 n=1 Tax=Didymodactylos carnosus TaxID=1234261 RepID=A0A813S5W9_9BILA|nr:unnamed protein product [Didymodactylos carnosus]CAF3574827.1 unnamed protein product [Didymodactylos carnosus]